MERVVIVGFRDNDEPLDRFENSLSEMCSLVETAGGVVVKTITQHGKKINPAYLIGRGKVEEIKKILADNSIHSVVFNRELRPTQSRNLEEELGVKIIDKTRLILDIFAHRARSNEGKLQVELAQMKYRLPRLTKKGLWLDGQFGGIGTRGPGEKKLEYDRRKIQDRIIKLEKEIKKIEVRREQQRKLRKTLKIPTVVLVGYTNVGKSTLLNTLIKRNDVYVDDKLFSTLDPTTRRVRLPSGRVVVFIDTVGFITGLPHQLIAAFRATLEETLYADLLLHVFDISHPFYEEQRKTVLDVLNEIGAVNIPIFEVYNKCDLLSSDAFIKKCSEEKILISALHGIGIDILLKKIDSYFESRL